MGTKKEKKTKEKCAFCTKIKEIVKKRKI